MAALGLAGCQTPLPNQTGQQTQQGALLGAGVGALAGALTGDDAEERVRNAAIGAAAVGAVGAAIGYSLDRQEAELRSELGPEFDELRKPLEQLPAAITRQAAFFDRTSPEKRPARPFSARALQL